jgi:hypothetical protein
MRFGKKTMFAILQGLILLVLLIHLGRWLFSSVVEGRVTTPYSATVMTVHYAVNGVEYVDTYMRNGYPLTPKTVEIRYLTYNPAKSRINTFMGIAAEPLAWWLVISVGMAALLLTDNTVFTKGTTFQLHKHFPWLSMDEYFPVKKRWFYRDAEKEYGTAKPPSPKKEVQKHRLPGQGLEK